MTNLIHNLFMEITTECNLRCQICDLWKRKDSISKLNIENKLKFLKNIFDWAEECYPDSRGDTNVILTGGEPFLFPDQVFMISDICRENHHNCYINTNGSLIRPRTDKILDSGLTAVTISIDSHHSKIHDILRQSPGLFKSVTRTIKILINKKRKENYPIKICIQSILGDWNIREVAEQVEFFKDLGIDGMQFQPFQHPFGRLIAFGCCKESDFFPNSHVEIDNAIDTLIKLKNKNSFIMNSVEEIQLFRQYFKNPESLPNRSCKAFDQNLIIDVCGNVKFCFNKSLEPADKIGNIITKKIDVLLNGKEATLVKESMRNCNSPCGIMMCHVSSNLRD
jgi:MoaA/NifB/PqqE/SkfB family radical SAM enzyme